MTMTRTMTRVCGVCALVAVGAVLGCGGPEEKKAQYTARAQAYIQESNFPKARVALRNVLKIDPKDAEAYFLFAQVEEKEKNWRSAFGNYLRTVELNPDHRGALLKLGKYYVEGRLPDKVLEVADKVLAKHPDDVAAQTLKAAVLAMTGRKPEAIAQAQTINARHPTDPDAALLLASVYTAQQRFTEAATVLRRAVDAQPQHVGLLTTLGATLVRTEDFAGAEQVLRRIVAVEPKVMDHRLLLARFYDHAKNPDKAEAVIREAVELDPDNEDRRLKLAEYLAARSDAVRGEAALLEARKALPYSMKIRFALGKHYESKREGGKARKIYEEVVDEKGTRPPGLEAQVKLAGLDLAEGRQEAAEKRLQEVLKENPLAADALLLHGKLAMGRKDGKEAVQSFRSVLKDQPDAADVQALLGQAYLLTGEASLARESLEKAVSLNPRQMDARRALAGLDAGEGRRNEARRHLEEILKEAPKDLNALGMSLGLQVADRDWSAAEATLSRLRETGANGLVIGMAEGNVYQARQQWDKALAAFERATAADPVAPDPLFSLVRIEIGRGRAAQARARLDDILSGRPDHPYAHGMLGEVLLLLKEETRAERELQEANRIKPDWVTPWLDRANLHTSRKNPSEAVQVLETGLKANPRSEELRVLLASMLNTMGQTDRAIKEYETVLRDNPQALVAANNLASMLADKKGDPPSLERALALSRDFEKVAPHPFFLDTLGWVYLKMGRSDDALRVIRQAVAKAPQHPVLNYHLGMAYYRAGEAKQARIYLEKAVHAGQAFPGLDEARTVLTTLSKG